MPEGLLHFALYYGGDGARVGVRTAANFAASVFEEFKDLTALESLGVSEVRYGFRTLRCQDLEMQEHHLDCIDVYVPRTTAAELWLLSSIPDGTLILQPGEELCTT